MAKNNGVVKIMEGFKIIIFSEQNYNEQCFSLGITAISKYNCVKDKTALLYDKKALQASYLINGEAFAKAATNLILITEISSG